MIGTDSSFPGQLASCNTLANKARAASHIWPHRYLSARAVVQIDSAYPQPRATTIQAVPNADDASTARTKKSFDYARDGFAANFRSPRHVGAHLRRQRRQHHHFTKQGPRHSVQYYKRDTVHAPQSIEATKAVVRPGTVARRLFINRRGFRRRRQASFFGARRGRARVTTRAPYHHYYGTGRHGTIRTHDFSPKYHAYDGPSAVLYGRRST